MDPTTCDVYQVIFVGLPRNHHAVFVETQEDESGMLYQVTGNVQEGMNFAFERSNKPAKSATFDSNSLMGKLAREDLDRFEEVCRGVPPPKKQFDRAHRLSPQEPLRRCQEWTTEAIQALRSAGLLQNIPNQTIDSLNALPLKTYCSQLFTPANFLTYTHKTTTQTLTLDLHSPTSLSPSVFTACLNLIATTSSAAYAASSKGWSRAAKRKEMRLPDLRYIILSKIMNDDNGRRSELAGFLSFMLTYEDGFDVIYCYEIHLAPGLEGQGLGKRLVYMMEDVGRKAGVQKAMLTVFVANEAARAFHHKLGYEVDEYSPRPRKLRNGVVKEVDYSILSKALVEEPRKLGGWGGRKRKVELVET